MKFLASAFAVQAKYRDCQILSDQAKPANRDHLKTGQ
jgi:hypothetical protein